jgi:type IV secretory pathway VirB6-like protein
MFKRIKNMTNYIMQILRSQLMVVFSWGFNTPTAIANGLRFKVQGFKFSGTVDVVYNESADLFDVKLIKNDKVVELVEGVYLDTLVDVIDCRVEKVDNYKQRIQKSL